MTYDQKIRNLTFDEVEAIRRVESRGIYVDWDAIHQKIEHNAQLGQPHLPVFSTIYKDYYDRLDALQRGDAALV